MTHVSPPKIYLLVDTFVGDGRDVPLVADVERGIAMAASIAHAACEAGLPCGLICFDGDRDRPHIELSDGEIDLTAGPLINMPPNRGKRHRRDVLTVLAKLDLNHRRDVSALQSAAFSSIKANTTAVLISPQQVQMSLGESVRGSVFSLPCAGPMASRWIRFGPTVDFADAAAAAVAALTSAPPPEPARPAKAVAAA
jgi:uncharacterized protein (DUF58 family)